MQGDVLSHQQRTYIQLMSSQGQMTMHCMQTVINRQWLLLSGQMLDLLSDDSCSPLIIVALGHILLRFEFFALLIRSLKALSSVRYSTCDNISLWASQFLIWSYMIGHILFRILLHVLLCFSNRIPFLLRIFFVSSSWHSFSSHSSLLLIRTFFLLRILLLVHILYQLSILQIMYSFILTFLIFLSLLTFVSSLLRSYRFIVFLLLYCYFFLLHLFPLPSCFLSFSLVL